MRKVVVFGALLFALSSGATARDNVSPSIGASASASVGEPIYEKSHYTAIPAYSIKEGFSGKNVFATVVLSPGDKFIQVPSKVKVKACRAESIERFQQKSYTACLYDDDGDGTFDRYGANEVQGGKKLPHPFAYSVSEFIEPTPDAVKQVVIYLGSTRDTLRLSYREFVNDMARPAFTEEYTFPLGTAFPQSVVFKGIRMTVTAIDGTGLHYRIDSVPA